MTKALDEQQTFNLEQSVGQAVNYARFLATESPSRELSLVITKLDEAQLWLNRVPTQLMM